MGLGAAGTAVNEVFVPASKTEVGLAMLGPLGKLGKLGKAAELAEGAGAAERGGINLFKWEKATTTKPGGWKEGDI